MSGNGRLIPSPITVDDRNLSVFLNLVRRSLNDICDQLDNLDKTKADLGTFVSVNDTPGPSVGGLELTEGNGITITIGGTTVTLSVNQAQLDHGSVGGLTDDDHSQYHNDARGDARYFQESEHLDTSAGAADAGKPIKLDAAGDVDATMINSADVDHDTTTNFVANEHLDWTNETNNLETSGRVKGGNGEFGGGTDFIDFDTSGMLRFQGAARYIIGTNHHAFKKNSDSIGIYFNASNNRIEHTDAVNARMFSCDIAGAGAGNCYVNGELEVDGDLNHDGTNIGFHGTAPVAQSTGWSMSNVSSDKVLDADSTTLAEVADVLGTLIDDLKANGLLGA